MTEQERSEHSLAIFIDFENLALGFKDRRERFDIVRVLKRLVEKGKIVSKKAYADWNRYHVYTEALHEAAIELIEIPRRMQSGKNSADIRLVVDAMDLSYSKEHIDTFVVVSGDSDFSPLVSKLKELGKHVIGLGMQDSTSELLRDNCDEFIYYEDLGEETIEVPDLAAHLSDTKKKVFALLYEAIMALRRENKEVMWSSMIKDTIKRKKPSFNETYYGYQTFSELLEDAAREGVVEVEKHKRSGTYVVTRFGDEMRRAPRRRLDLDLEPLAEGRGRSPSPRMPSEDRPRRGAVRNPRGRRTERRPRTEDAAAPRERPDPAMHRLPPPESEPLLAEPAETRAADEQREPDERPSRGRTPRTRTAPRGERPMRTYDVERELPPPEEAPVERELPAPPRPILAEPPPLPPPSLVPPAAPPPQRSFGAGVFDE